MKKILTLLFLIVLTACANNSETRLTESFGIVSLSPSVTETLLHLGLADYIVGIDIHSERFGFSEDIPRFNMMSLDVEYLTVLNPEIIFAAFPVDERLDVVMIPPVSQLSEIEEQILLIASLTDSEAAANVIINDMNTRIHNVLNFISTLENETITAYFEIGVEPSIFTVGHGTFIHEIMEMMGIINIFHDTPGWIPAVEEEVIARNPQIIFTNVGYLDDPVSEIINRPGWGTITAISEGNVFYIDSHSSSASNHTIALVVEQMATALVQSVR